MTGAIVHLHRMAQWSQWGHFSSVQLVFPVLYQVPGTGNIE